MSGACYGEERKPWVGEAILIPPTCMCNLHVSVCTATHTCTCVAGMGEGGNFIPFVHLISFGSKL